MVRHRQFLNGTGRSGSAKYFTEHLAERIGAYYAREKPTLRGKTLEWLKLLKTEVDERVFTALENNLNPETGDRLTPRTNGKRMEWGVNDKTGKPELQEKDNRRTGMDLPMIAPKTVSEVWAMSTGEFKDAIMNAFMNAADKGMELAESLAKTRVRKGGAFDERVVGNLLYLSVVHHDARPVGSNVPDFMLHRHHYIFNVCMDHVEKRLKAVDVADVLKFAETIDAVFLAELEKGLTALGIGTERTPDGRSFEISGVKGKEIFSKRRNEILKSHFNDRDRIECLVKHELWKAAKVGKVLDYDRVKTEVRNRLGKALAQKKVPIATEEKLAALRAQMTPEIKESLQEDAVKHAPRKNWRTPDEAREEVVYSAFKNYSVVHEMNIAAQLLRATGGKMTLDEALNFARSDAFIRLDDHGHVTTELVKREEAWMLDQVKGGQDKHESAVPKWMIFDKVLALDQLRSIQFILNSKDFMMDVSGIAGAGKTTLLKETVKALSAKGINVVMLAPTSASEKKLKEDFPDAITVQRFDVDEAFRKTIPSGSFIFVDEVSMVSVPQLARLVSYAKERDWRLVTLGDRDQHASPERGEAIRILQDSGSVRSSKLTETYRAKVKYLKQCVLELKAGGKLRELAFERLNVHGDIIEVEDPDTMRAEAIKLHLDCVREGQIGILACPVHSEAREVAAVVRQILKDEDEIEKEDHTIRRLQRVDAENVELRDPRHYETGRVVIFRSLVAGGFKSAEKWSILPSLPGTVGKVCLTREKDGKTETKTLDLESKGQWNVYNVEEMQLSVGDQIRITEGFSYMSSKFKNNDIAKVAKITATHIHLDDGRCMERDLVHLDQGVCITSYATQCRTVRQMVALAPILSFSEMTAKTFYVLASRATHRAVFFTDCKEALKEAVLRPGERRAVWDYSKSALAFTQTRNESKEKPYIK